MLLALLATAQAADVPAKAVAYRQAVMAAIGSHMRATSMIVKGEIARPADIALHADAIAAGAALIVPLFPAGTGPDVVPDTHAKPDVWTKAAEFETAARTLETEAKKLAELSRTNAAPAAISTQMTVVGKSCGSCHDGFKVDDD